MARETRRLGGARTTGGVEGALTGSASAGIRALQILLVREPATGIGGEGGGGGRGGARVTWLRYLRCWRLSGLLSGLAGSSATPQKGLTSRLTDEPVTERRVAATTRGRSHR